MLYELSEPSLTPGSVQQTQQHVTLFVCCWHILICVAAVLSTDCLVQHPILAAPLSASLLLPSQSKQHLCLLLSQQSWQQAADSYRILRSVLLGTADNVI